MIQVFPPFRLDGENQCLWRENTRIPLAPKAFGVLRYLVERPGKLVSQEELLEALWPDTFVQPEILRKYILEIRKVLQDPPRTPRFVETVPRRGYRFLAAVREASAPGEATDLGLAVGLDRVVGRGSVLTALDSILKAAVHGDRQIVFITGEAGIGKTTLVDAFHQRLQRNSGQQTARGQCVEGFGGKEPYYPVLEAFGLFMRAPGGERLTQTLAAHAPTWLIQFPSLINPEQRGILLQEILGATRERMVREFCEAMELLTADRPLVMILEDLQWVDDSTLDLISALARRRGMARLLLLGTYRPVELTFSGSPLKLLKQDLLVHHLCHEFALAPLTPPDIEQYLAAEFPASGLGRDLAGLIHRHSDGNPMFMVALLERLRQQGWIALRDDRWVLTVSPGHIDPGVPETLQQMLEVQLEQVGGQERQVLRAASVSGRRFSSWAVAAVLNGEPDPVEEVCENLAGGQQFIRRGAVQELPDGSATTQYEFKHALYRAVLYRQLSPTQLRQFHLRLAKRMEALTTPPDLALASELAAHFEAGRDTVRAVRYLILSAAAATRRYGHREALQVLNRALELAPLAPEPHPELEIQILERTSDVLYALGEMVQSAAVDTRVAELADRGGFKVAQVNALTRLARALAFFEPDRCIAVCERAAAVARTHDDLLLQARAEMLMACWQIVTNGWRREYAEICAASRARIRALSDELPAYFEILYAHVQCAQGDYRGACQTARAGIPQAVRDESLVVYLSAHSSLVHALLHLGEWGELLQVLHTALEVAEKNGNAPWMGIFRAQTAWLHFHAGNFDEARRMAEELLASDSQGRSHQVHAMARVTAGFADLETGRSQEAQRYFTEVCESPTHPRFFLDWYWRLVARLGLANACLDSGEWQRASAETEGVLQAACATADPALQALAWETRGRVAYAAGDLARAFESLNHAFAAVGDPPVPWALWRIHATASALNLSAGNRQEADRHRKRASEILAQLSSSFAEGEPLRETLLAIPAQRPLRAVPVGHTYSVGKA